MKAQNSHTIIKTFIDKRGHLMTNSTGIVGGTEMEAMMHFDITVRAAGSTHPQIVGIVLVDAADTVMAEWARADGMVAA